MKPITLMLILLVTALISWAQADVGINALNTGMFPTAKRWFLNQVNDSLTSPEAFYHLGEVYRKSGNSDSAMICYNKGINGNVSNPLCMVAKAGLIMASESEKALALIKEATTEKSYKKNPALQVAIAIVYSDNKMYDQASQYLKLAKEKNPKYPGIYLAEGDMLLDQKRVGDATNKYETAIYYDTNCKPAYLKIAQIYYLAKYYDQSISYLERIKLIDPHFPAALKLIGDIGYDQGKYSEAIAAYSEYLQTSEAGINDHVRYAYALFFNKEYDKSSTEIKNLVPAYPGNIYLKRVLAYNLYETGKYDEAMEQMKEFFKVADESSILPTDYKYYARMLSKNNLDSLSAVNFEKAIALSEKAEEYYKELALLYEKMKRFDRAAFYFEKYIRATANPANSDFFLWGRDGYFAASSIDSSKIANDATQAIVRQKLYEKADSIFALVNNASPNSHLGSLWRARVNAILDPETQLGLAKPYYERVAEILGQPGKNSKKELIEAYQYLGYYYYLKSDLTNSKLFWNKIIEIDPNNSTALKAIKEIK
jgi:tetratricopeptide (TPR) repeat protein